VAFVHRHDDPFDHRVAEGHITGSAFVLDPSGRLLLTHHRKLGIWVQLGGHAEDERRAADVALREAREESGLPDLVFAPELMASGQPRLLDVDVHRIPPRGDRAEHDHLDLRFLLRTARPELIAADLRETKALEWVALAEARARCEAAMGRAFTRIEALLARDGVRIVPTGDEPHVA
jgi:8-oxo-dGTP pyrophosphatase MutT (NUDIX family)